MLHIFLSLSLHTTHTKQLDCVFAEHAYNAVSAPVFLMNTLYDPWALQVIDELCSVRGRVLLLVYLQAVV
jgi:hypothetical protein